MFKVFAYDIVRLASFGLLVSCSLTLSSCSSTKVEPEQEPAIMVVRREKVISKPAPVPPGVVRYCWEEPIVEFEPNGPGVDPDGNWYHKSYSAVREVRQGKWRPCRAVISETAGGVK